MISLVLDPSRLRLGVAGSGPAAERRLSLLRAAGAEPLALSASPGPGIPALDLLWIADLTPPEAARLAAAARAQGALVNVEDQPALSDFRNTAELRRGDLLVSVSTGGQSPGLAGAIRDRIGALFGPDWAGRVAALGARRRIWRAEGRGLAELARLSREAIARSGWLA
ncbi:MAG: precorrin-2 dehydrogenase/sirohydrochlorin ferrochelatase family protein [Acetobacteraceae bacterium]